MKTLKAVLLVAVLGVLLGITTLASADAITDQKGTRITVYDAKEKCRVICKAPKPALEVLEDGLAFVLDIPLAMLSPIMAPIATCIADEDDRPGQRYRRSKK